MLENWMALPETYERDANIDLTEAEIICDQCDRTIDGEYIRLRDGSNVCDRCFDFCDTYN